MSADTSSKPAAIPLFAPANRRRAVGGARSVGFTSFPPIIDPTAICPASLDIGEGSYINAGAVNGGNSKLGNFVLINRQTSIGHHASFADYVSVGPGVTAAGGVEIGTGALIGAGAVIMPQVKIGADAKIAAGAVIRTDIPPCALATGNPGRVIKSGASQGRT